MMDLKLTHEKAELFLGRQQSCDVVLSSEVVSRKHARVFKEGTDWFLEDLNSKHGTKLNEISLAAGEKKLLRAGDQIQIGDETLQVSIEQAELNDAENYYLVQTTGSEAGRKTVLNPQQAELIFGRSQDVNVPIDNKSISRKHLKIKQDIDGVWAEDLNSKNGVWINGQKITQPTLLKDSDEIQIGDLKYTFVDANAALLQRLEVIPAFKSPQQPEPVAPVSAVPERPAAPTKVPPQAESSHWIDYAYVGLMSLVVVGILVGAFLWIKG